MPLVLNLTIIVYLILALPMAGTDMAAARTASLDKMVGLVAVLVEKSRGEDNLIHLAQVHSETQNHNVHFACQTFEATLSL